MDITTTYFDSLMEEENYMGQIQFHAISEQEHLLRKLKLWSYGLPESSYHWYKTEELKSMGFHQSLLNPCIFYSKDHRVFIFIHVIDLGLIGTKFNFKDREL